MVQPIVVGSGPNSATVHRAYATVRYDYAGVHHDYVTVRYDYAGVHHDFAKVRHTLFGLALASRHRPAQA